MSIMQTKTVTPLQFFRSSAAPCPYLAGRIERKLFARLAGEDANKVNNRLTFAGFRRSHDIIYKPACQGCQACVPVRVPSTSFSLSANQKRLLGRRRMTFIQRPATALREHYALFITYQTSRHRDSDMAHMSFDDYAAMISEGDVDTHLFELREERGAEAVLMGVMLADKLSDGWSAVYSFYKTDASDGDGNVEALSLGTQLILRLALFAKEQQDPYVYLGFWVDNSPKMAYKSRFKPLERLTPNGWQPVQE